MLPSTTFRPVSAPSGGAGTAIALTGEYSTWTAGATHGDVGEYTTGAIYQWHSSKGWMPPDAFSAGTFTDIHTVVGTEDEAGWNATPYTVVKAGAGAVTQTTVGGRNYTNFDSDASNGDKCYLEQTGLTPNVGRLYQGWIQVVGAGGGANTSCTIPWLQNGKLYWLNGAWTTSTAAFGTNAGVLVGMSDSGNTDMQTAPVWATILIKPNGGAASVWINHSPCAVASVSGTQCSTDTSNAEKFGDQATGGKSAVALGAGFYMALIS